MGHKTGTTERVSARTFAYHFQNAEGQSCDGTLTLPHTGFLDKLKDTFDDNIRAGAANILTPEMLAYCLGRIEAKHTTRSAKAVGYLELANLMLLESRPLGERISRTSEFLLQHAARIGQGLTRPAVEGDFYRQSDPAGLLIEVMAGICGQVGYTDERRAVIDELIEAYSSPLADFFHVPADVDRRAYSDTHEYSSHLFMQVLTSCRLETPEFFREARLEYLRWLAHEAFEYSSRPHEYTHHKALGIGRDFAGIAPGLQNGIGTSPADPIHLAGDGENSFLIMARDGRGALAYIFSATIGDAEPVGICASSIASLQSAVGAIRTTGQSLQQPLERALRNLA